MRAWLARRRAARAEQARREFEAQERKWWEFFSAIHALQGGTPIPFEDRHKRPPLVLCDCNPTTCGTPGGCRPDCPICCPAEGETR
jgi:hypothetical protein